MDNVKAAGACEDNYGVAVIHYPESSVAAVFTSNKVQAAPILVTREAVKNGKLSAIVANSGNANCFTGKKGVENAQLWLFRLPKISTSLLEMLQSHPLELLADNSPFLRSVISFPMPYGDLTILLRHLKCCRSNYDH